MRVMAWTEDGVCSDPGHPCPILIGSGGDGIVRMLALDGVDVEWNGGTCMHYVPQWPRPLQSYIWSI